MVLSLCESEEYLGLSPSGSLPLKGYLRSISFYNNMLRWVRFNIRKIREPLGVGLKALPQR
ncbi:MAG: hypothetical protein ABIM74_06785 [candidate division WOR-3 bacterium]